MAILDEIDTKVLKDRERALEGHSAQIGRMCTLYSGLELDIAHLLISLAGLSDPVPKNVLIGALDMRAKLNAVLTIGFERKPSDIWFAELNKLVNSIDNGIRTERNRMIHDFWLSVPEEDGTETMQRVQLRASLKKEPPSGTQTLRLADFKPVKPAEIAELCEVIFAANLTAIRLRREFERAPLHGKLQPPNPPQSQTSDQTGG